MYSWCGNEMKHTVCHNAWCFLFSFRQAWEQKGVKFKFWSQNLDPCVKIGEAHISLVDLDLNRLDQLPSHLTGNQWIVLTCTAQWSAVLKSLSTSVGSAPFCSKACTCSGRLWKDAQWSAVMPYQDKSSNMSFNILVINCEATYSS